MMSHSRKNQNSFVIACRSVTLILIIATSILIFNERIQFGQAVGLGDKAIWKEGALLGDEFNTEHERTDVNALFKRPNELKSGGELSQEQVDKLYERYVDLVKHWPIEVVDARRDLTRLMKLVSTKSQAQFLARHDDYYKQLKVGTTNRPMLMSYLGLRLSSREDMHAWLDKAVRGPAGTRIANACSSLLATRDKHAPTETKEAANEKLLEDLRELQPKRAQAYRFHLAHLTFENNMKLFMLENFLILCSRLNELVPQKVRMSDFGSQYKPLF